MSSLRKIDSCRKNGALSNGPVTPEGKDHSAMNGLRHGFAASRIVLATEDRAQFDALRESFIQIHAPANDVETALVDQMVVAQWRLLRMWAGEAAILDRRIAKLSPDSAPAPELTPFDQFGQAFETFANGESPLKLMSRYQTDCRWQYDRAFRSLNALRESQPDEPSRPVIGPDTVVKFYYCAHTRDKCTDENRLPDCPRQEPCPVPAIGEEPTLPVSPTEPNPKNEHPIETAPDKPPASHESPTEPSPTNEHRSNALPPTNDEQTTTNASPTEQRRTTNSERLANGTPNPHRPPGK